MIRFTRFWLPVIVVIAGIGVMLVGRNEDALLGGAGIVGAGLSIWLLNVLYRIGVSGDRARDAEEEARAYFERHGRWPDEPAPPRKEHKTRSPHEHPHRSPPRRPR